MCYNVTQPRFQGQYQNHGKIIGIGDGSTLGKETFKAQSVAFTSNRDHR